MEFGTGMILDIVLAVILAGIAWKAWKAGFVAAFISLIGTLAGYLGAAVLSGPVSRWLYVSVAHDRVLEYVSDRLPDQVAGVPLDSLGELAELKDQAIAHISGVLEELGLDWGLLSQGEATGSDAAHQIYGQVAEEGHTMAQAIVDVVAGPAVEFAIRIGVFFLLFFLIMLVVRMLVGLGRGVNHVPLVGGFNRLLGLGLGCVQAAVAGYLITMALMLLITLSGNRWGWLNSHVISETNLILWFRNLDIMNLLS